MTGPRLTSKVKDKEPGQQLCASKRLGLDQRATASRPCTIGIDQGRRVADCVVTADEPPNFPHPGLKKIGNYAKVKIKEAVLAVTGG